MRLKDKVALVTGSGSGLGRAIALRFAQEGAMVVVSDVNEATMAATVQDVQAAGGQARGWRLDVTDEPAVRAVVDAVTREHGRIDILVNNAGATRYRAFEDTRGLDWDSVLDLDLKAVFACAQAVAAPMVRQRYGKIVNISSSLGTGTTPHIGRLGPGAAAPYASAKAGVIMLTQILARELGPSGVNVNCVAPGFFLTPLTGTTRSPAEVEDHIRFRSANSVLQRPGRLEELAAAVLFLASDEASFITGETLRVDGGRTDRM